MERWSSLPAEPEPYMVDCGLLPGEGTGTTRIARTRISRGQRVRNRMVGRGAIEGIRWGAGGAGRSVLGEAEQARDFAQPDR